MIKHSICVRISARIILSCKQIKATSMRFCVHHRRQLNDLGDFIILEALLTVIALLGTLIQGALLQMNGDAASWSVWLKNLIAVNAATWLGIFIGHLFNKYHHAIHSYIYQWKRCYHVNVRDAVLQDEHKGK